eukprot:gene22364-32623_t
MSKERRLTLTTLAASCTHTVGVCVAASGVFAFVVVFLCNLLCDCCGSVFCDGIGPRCPGLSVRLFPYSPSYLFVGSAVIIAVGYASVLHSAACGDDAPATMHVMHKVGCAGGR